MVIAVCSRAKCHSNQPKLKHTSFKEKEPMQQLDPNAYAYAAERSSLTDGKSAGLIKAGLRVYYNTVPLTNSGKRWERGSVFVLRGEKQAENLTETIAQIAQKTGQEVTAIRSGFSDQGPDLGSNSMQFITNRTIGILKVTRRRQLPMVSCGTFLNSNFIIL